MEESKFVQSRKRPLEQDSPYFKMRALLRDLRPHFIEVLKIPDFRNCKAADEIREGMKQLMQLYRELTTETVKLAKCSNGDISNGREPMEHEKDVKPSDNRHIDDVMSIPPPGDNARGTYIVGGSAFGWNFITYNGRGALYYGRTKEAYRAANSMSN